MSYPALLGFAQFPPKVWQSQAFSKLTVPDPDPAGLTENQLSFGRGFNSRHIFTKLQKSISDLKAWPPRSDQTRSHESYSTLDRLRFEKKIKSIQVKSCRRIETEITPGHSSSGHRLHLHLTSFSLPGRQVSLKFPLPWPGPASSTSPEGQAD
jgi:hypothetical protein